MPVPTSIYSMLRGEGSNQLLSTPDYCCWMILKSFGLIEDCKHFEKESGSQLYIYKYTLHRAIEGAYSYFTAWFLTRILHLQTVARNHIGPNDIFIYTHIFIYKLTLERNHPELFCKHTGCLFDNQAVHSFRS
jgi:hypothetical protein